MCEIIWLMAQSTCPIDKINHFLINDRVGVQESGSPESFPHAYEWNEMDHTY